MEEEMVKSMEEKISHGGLEITVRLVSSADSKERALMNLENIINSFSQYNIYRYGNSFGAVIPRNPNALIRESIYRSFREGHYMVANTGWARAKPLHRSTYPKKVLLWVEPYTAVKKPSFG